MGVMMMGNSSLPGLDRFTRALSLLAWLSTTPRGIAEMEPGCGYLGALSLTSKVTPVTFAGTYNTNDYQQEGYACFLGGFAQAAFQGMDNDLVVSVKSATIGQGTLLRVSHFAYLTSPQATNAVAQLAEPRVVTW